MILTKEELLTKLPTNRDFWFSSDICAALGIHRRTIQKLAKRLGVGKKVRHGPRGTYIFQYKDLDIICENTYGEVGNPVNIAKSRGRL